MPSGKPSAVHDFTDAALAAVSSRNPEVVRAVYEAGGDFTVSDKDDNGWTPALAAVSSGNPEVVKLVEEIAAKQREEKARAAQSARPVDVYLSKEKEDEREAERAKIRAATEQSIAEHDPMPELGKEGGASKSSTESQESPDDPAR